MKIHDSMVLITGASSGIGREITKVMSELGAKLILIDINKKGLDETVEMITKAGGVVLTAGIIDITDFNEMKKFALKIHSEFGPLDILVNNAGIATIALVEDMTHELWEKTIDVNLKGTIHGIECFLPEMIRARKGHVVCVASTAGLIGVPWQAAYCASKWGVVGLTEVLRYDLMQHNIGVTVVCPGFVNTPLFNTVNMPVFDKNREAADGMKKDFKKLSTTPEHIAKLTVRAVMKNRYMVIAPLNSWIIYHVKSKVFFLYHLVMIFIISKLNKERDKYINKRG
jgi:NADP-dependent 3-hydroxy acid dehydrogenase YdfG